MTLEQDLNRMIDILSTHELVNKHYDIKIELTKEILNKYDLKLDEFNKLYVQTFIKRYNLLNESFGDS